MCIIDWTDWHVDLFNCANWDHPPVGIRRIYSSYLIATDECQRDSWQSDDDNDIIKYHYRRLFNKIIIVSIEVPKRIQVANSLLMFLPCS